MHSLTIPQHNDPIARFGLIAAGCVLIYLAFAPGAQIGQPQTAAAQDAIIQVVATPTLPAPTLPPIGAGIAPTPASPPAGGQATVESVSPQTEEPGGSALVHNADGSVSLPGSEPWIDPAPAVETQGAAAPNPLAVDPAVYRSLPVAGQPSASNEQPNTARRPHTGR